VSAERARDPTRASFALARRDPIALSRDGLISANACFQGKSERFLAALSPREFEEGSERGVLRKAS